MSSTDSGLTACLNYSQQPTFAEPPAMICQQTDPQLQFKNIIKTDPLNGHSSDETFQPAFYESYFVAVQSRGPAGGSSVLCGAISEILHLQSSLNLFSTTTPLAKKRDEVGSHTGLLTEQRSAPNLGKHER